MPFQFLRAATLLLAAASASAVLAAEDFRVRYNLAGSIGGEIFAPQSSSGWIGALAYTYIDGRKVTGDDGNKLGIATPPGIVPLSKQATPLDPVYNANRVALQTSGHANVMALALGYITEERYGGGQLIVQG